MLLIKVKPGISSIHGLGLFADQFIAKGTRVWQFSPILDREIPVQDFVKLSKLEQEYLLFYGFLSKKSGNYHLSFDNVKFINHAMPGNIISDLSAINEIEYPLIASSDIQPGEELTQNYKDFEVSGHGL